MIKILLALLLALGTISFQPTKGDDSVVEHSAFILSYDEKNEQAKWVHYKLTSEMLTGSRVPRSNRFKIDPYVFTGSASASDYYKSGYDKGHLCPAADMSWSQQTMEESFYMSNMSPQKPAFNRGIWKKLESKIRKWAIKNEEIYVTTGPIFGYDNKTIGDNKVSVPESFYKVIIDIKCPEIKGIGFIIPNTGTSESLKSFAITIDDVEISTGIDFFCDLSYEIQDCIESMNRPGLWGF
jgi:endonuclease G